MKSQKFKIMWLLFVSICIICVLPYDDAQGNSQAPRGAFTIAVIKSRESTLYNSALAGFKNALKDKGVSMSNWSVYSMAGGSANGRKIISQIKAEKPDLILTLGTTATTLASENINDLPIVFSAVLNPVDSGFVKSMKSSCNNLTGASMDIPIRTQFKWFKKVVPNVKRIGVLYNPDETKAVIDKALIIAESEKLKLITAPVYSERDVPKATKNLVKRVDALWAVADSKVFGSMQSAKFILLHTLRTKTPFMGLSRAFVKSGALLALSCKHEDIGRQSGELAIRILSGEAPSAIPVTAPRKVSLSLNLIVAEQIGIKLPSNITDKADEVFR